MAMLMMLPAGCDGLCADQVGVGCRRGGPKVRHLDDGYRLSLDAQLFALEIPLAHSHHWSLVRSTSEYSPVEARARVAAGAPAW